MAVDIRLDLWPKQMMALQGGGTEVLYGGATRSGKSHLARVILIGACLKIKNLSCVLIRKKYQDILDNHLYPQNGFYDVLRPLIANGFCKVTQDAISFQNGSRISFKHCQDERQMDSAQGISTQILVIDEATQISERLIRMFRGWVTITEEMKAELPEFFKNKLPLILYTANPIGPSVGYFRREFVKARPPLVTEKVGAFHRQYIPANVADNPSENAEAVRGRMNEMGDAALTKALLEGDWDQLVGEFFPEWDEERHVVPDFTPPQHWFRFKGMDLGYAEPFYVSWVAVSDGEVFRDSQNRERWFPRGAFVCYREWYGADKDDTSKGIRMRNEDIAAGIFMRSDEVDRKGIVLTDSLPFQDRGGDNVPKVFAKEGVTIIQGDTSRIVGWNQFRSRLIGKEFSDGKRLPMFYLTESCTAGRDYIPQLARHPSESKKEDAQEHGEATHVNDVFRIICMAHTVIKDGKDIRQTQIDAAMRGKMTARSLTTQNGVSIFS